MGTIYEADYEGSAAVDSKPLKVSLRALSCSPFADSEPSMVAFDHSEPSIVFLLPPIGMGSEGSMMQFDSAGMGGKGGIDVD